MLMNALSEDCGAVQSAISEKVRHPSAELEHCVRCMCVLTPGAVSAAQVANFVQQIATFIAGLIVGAQESLFTDAAAEMQGAHVVACVPHGKNLTCCITVACTQITTDCRHHRATMARAAFTHSWSLTLVMLGLAPVIVTAGYLVSMATARLSTRAADAYAEAAAVVAESLGAIRTVLALCGAPAIVQKYAAVCATLCANLNRVTGAGQL